MTISTVKLNDYGPSKILIVNGSVGLALNATDLLIAKGHHGLLQETHFKIIFLTDHNCTKATHLRNHNCTRNLSSVVSSSPYVFQSNRLDKSSQRHTEQSRFRHINSNPTQLPPKYSRGLIYTKITWHRRSHKKRYAARYLVRSTNCTGIVRQTNKCSE